ncbi:MAG TPA: protein kinase [Pyrinomonadaceae bacterium]|nr:protein kinase [Pyrinomonadaceae bacterium]
MRDQYWDNLKEIFHGALACVPSARAAYLDQATDGDPSLRQAVESLLKSHEETDNFVDAPAYQAAADMLADGREFRKGQVVGHYQIISLLGVGGMGSVYLAEDTKLYRQVSLKFLSNNFVKDYEHLHRFEQEARAASALNHPNILTIHEISEVDGHQFIATEYIEGQTLRDRLRSGLDIENALEIAIQVASALVAAHRVNIVHRDIKPENIMIRHDDGLVKVLDFGLAKMSTPKTPLDSTAARLLPTNTAPGLVIGTLAYMSPEQARGDVVDERTDIWSLGAVIYEMIAGSSPFIAATSNEIISGILSGISPRPLSHCGRLVPPGLVEIVQKALKKNVDERYQSSKDVLTDLRLVRQSLELSNSAENYRRTSEVVDTAARKLDLSTAETRPVSSVEYVVRKVRNHKRAAVVLATVLVAIVVFGASYRLIKPTVNAAPSRIHSLAVLPLKSLDTSENYIGVGIADAVIRRISQSGRLTVRPTSAVLKYVKEDTDSLTAAHQLGADAILEGTVQRAGDRLRVTVNLLRSTDGASLYTDNFDLTTADVFAIQDRVAQQVAERLQVSFEDSQPQHSNLKYPTDPRAYESYIKGVTSLDERVYFANSMSQMNETIKFFQKAIEIDPRYALAHAQLAFAYVWTALFIEPGETKWASLAQAEMKSANDLDPNLAETHIAHALLLWSSYEGYQSEQAIRELRLVKQLNPNVSSADLPALYGHLGLDDLASRELERALEINPTSASLKDLPTTLAYIRADADAFLAARQKTGDDPSSPGAFYYLRKGRLDDAQRVLDERLQNNAHDPDLLIKRCLVLALKGDYQNAESSVPEILASIKLSDQSRHHATYDAACIFALGGKSAEAVRWLKETATTGFPNYPLFQRDPFLNRIRQSPEFIQFMAEQKAQWERYRQEFSVGN